MMMLRFPLSRLIVSAAALGLAVPAASPADEPSRELVAEALGRMVLERDSPMDGVREFVRPLIPPMPDVTSESEWTEAADQIRTSVLDNVVFRGEAAAWRDAECKVEWLDTIEGGPGYRIRKLVYEAVPGFWIPALLYEPEEVGEKVPVVLNVNGHDGVGKAADYKQLRCINLAKRGMYALNVEWIGMGQLRGDGYKHGLINAIDLCGSGGIATHYLAMGRAVDLLLELPGADPGRVGLAGLSGGGWQTIFYSALDTRITLSNPVAGYSSFLTRIDYLSDLGDPEQTPCDLATEADYTHLTALLAPRPALLTFNQKDNCCFAAPHAMPPLVGAAAPIYSLFGRGENLRLHVNSSPGDHNFGIDNRQALYRMIGGHWFPDDPDYNPAEIPSEDEVKTADELDVPLPEGTLDLRTLALSLAESLPNPVDGSEDDLRAKLREIVKPVAVGENILVNQIANNIDQPSHESLYMTWTQLSPGEEWTFPAVRMQPAGGDVTGTVLLMADGGRTDARVVDLALAYLAEGKRVVAIDPFYFGEAKPDQRDYLWALMIATVGERPLGVQVGQVMAAARASGASDGSHVPSIHAVGPRAGVVALIAAALAPDQTEGVTLEGSMDSLKDLIERGQSFEQSPELFCFGLLEAFDLPEIEALVAPRPVERAD